MYRFLAFFLVAGVVGCLPVPPAPPAPHAPMAVQASFGRTWDATIDVFAERNIPIKNVDRASGLIVAENQKVGQGGQEFADCGSSPMAIPFLPTDAAWNILVRGDSTQSTVRASVRFLAITTGTGATTVECSSKGVWETQLEQRIKTSAEARRGP